MENETIGQRFKQWRINKENLTQEEISLKLEIPVDYISATETRNMTLNQKTLILLIQKYGLNINWLLTGHGKPDIKID